MIEIVVFTTKWKENDHTTIIATYDDLPAGTCMIDYNHGDKKEAFLWNLQVAKKGRHLGIGHELLDFAVNNAMQHKCKAISLEWNPRDSEGWVFDWYKRNGFEVDGNGRYGIVRMTKQLEKGGNEK